MSVKNIFILFCLTSDVFTYKLSQVVIISRHNIRYPHLDGNVEKATPNIWPQWDKAQKALLTEKGGILEANMGEYFSQWLQQEGLFEECPGDEAVVYVHNFQRTIETANKFTGSAFKNCHISLIIKKDYFSRVIRNTSEEFKRKAIEEMKKKLKEVNLTDTYQKLNTILDIKNSLLCKEESFCDFTEMKHKFIFENGKDLEVLGPPQIANSAVDIFLMSYYTGTPREHIGWGKIKNEDWETLTKVSKGYPEISYNVTYSCTYLAKQLLNEMYHITNTSTPKFSMFVGHKSTLTSILCALRFKYTVIPNSLEFVPMGSKLVFQKWVVEESGQFLLKINLVYATAKQMRHGDKLSLDSPPNSVVMELEDCPVDDNGFCPWSDFMKIFERIRDQ